MVKLTNWSAKRAGSTITIIGRDEAGKEQKITGVGRIFQRPPGFGQSATRTIAYVGNGKEVELL